jgi:hypothetical protein
VEYGADDARGYPVTRAADEDQGFERSRAEGRACGLQLHEEEGAAADVSRHPGYQYTGDSDSSRMPDGEIDDDYIVERLGRIFKDMPAYTPCPVTEYSAAHPPNEVSSRTQCASTDFVVVFVLIQCACLQDDIVKFVSEPASPPRLVEIPKEGKGKAKERREVGERDDSVVVEDSSEEDDEETLQEQFQLWSRFSRPGLPNVPLIQDPPTSLEASLPAPPRKPHHVARKRVAKKLKVTETTSQEVNSSSRVVEFLSCDCFMC